MPRVVIIGGSGHVGTYLVPRLVEAGFEVVNVSRGEREPYRRTPPGKRCERSELDRDAEEKAGTSQQIRELQPDIVIDMICFTARQRAASGRSAARAGAAFPALRHDLGARAERRGADHREPAAPADSANTASRRRPSRRTCSMRRGGTASRRRSLHPGAYRRAGLGAAEPGRPFQSRSLHHARQGEELALPKFRHGDRASRPRRRRSADVHAGDRELEQLRSARASTWCRRRRSACAATPRRWPPGSARSRTSLPAVAE